MVKVFAYGRWLYGKIVSYGEYNKTDRVYYDVLQDRKGNAFEVNFRAKKYGRGVQDISKVKTWVGRKVVKSNRCDCCGKFCGKYKTCKGCMGRKMRKFTRRIRWQR